MAAFDSHFRIEKITAFTAVDPLDDAEGLVGFKMPTGDWMPMVGADEKRVEDLRGNAQEIANVTGKPITLVQFSVREDIETIKPEGST